MSRSASGELRGIRVAVTRPPRPDDALCAHLSAAGAVVLRVPLVRIGPPADLTPLHQAAARLGEYDWLVFTSATAVGAFQEAVAAAGVAAGAWPHLAAVGPATAQAALNLLGRHADAVPAEYTGATLTAAMDPVLPVAGRRVLWPCAEDARPELSAHLRAAGAILDAPVAYRTLGDLEGARRLAALMADAAVDVVTLTSPSAARTLAEVAPVVGAVRIAVIGGTTEAAANAVGLPVHIVATESTIDALAAAVVADAQARRGRQG